MGFSQREGGTIPAKKPFIPDLPSPPKGNGIVNEGIVCIKREKFRTGIENSVFIGTFLHSPLVSIGILIMGASFIPPLYENPFSSRRAGSR